MFAWYWVADLCQAEGIPFVLGHALYMKAIHGGKTKNDKIDSHKIAALLRGGIVPAGVRLSPGTCARPATCCGAGCIWCASVPELVAHIQNTNQYNLPAFAKKLTYAANREELKWPNASKTRSVRKSVEVDLAVIDALNQTLRQAGMVASKRPPEQHDYHTLYLLRSIPGVGQILALVILYEIQRYQTLRKRCKISHPTPGWSDRSKNPPEMGRPGNKKIGNHHLKWAINESVILMLRESDQAKDLCGRP